MPHVASGPGAKLQAALDTRGWGKRTLAAKVAQQSGGTIDGWRSQVTRIIKGQQPERPTAIKLARALEEPDDYLLNGEEDEAAALREAVQLLLGVSRVLAEQVVKLGGTVPRGTLAALQRAADDMRP